MIDVGGRDTGSLRAALTVSDLVLVPVQPRSFDVWALNTMAALVAEAREINPELRALAFLNAADAQGRDNAEAREAMADLNGIAALDVVIVRRKAFPNAAAQGRGVVEMRPPDGKAVEELNALCVSDVAAARGLVVDDQACPQQRLNFIPEPQGHGSLRPILLRWGRGRGVGRLARMLAIFLSNRMARGICAAASSSRSTMSSAGSNISSGPRSIKPTNGVTIGCIRSSLTSALHSAGTSAIAFQNPLTQILTA